MTGTVSLDGIINAALSGFTPVSGTVFELLQFGSLTGDFETKNYSLGNGLGLLDEYDTDSLTLTTVFLVDGTADTLDVNPGDGIVADASGNATLRAAIIEANARAGADGASAERPDGL